MELLTNTCPQIQTAYLPILFTMAIWSIFWKGTALWHAARKKDSAWFIILMVFNTLGILELIYLFGVAKVKSNKLFK